MSTALLNSTLSTGLLQYKRIKRFMGPGFTFAETENFVYSCFVTNFNSGNYSPSSLQNDIQNTFQNLYQNNVYVRVFSIPGNFNETNDAVRIQRFNVEVENRLPILNLDSMQPELDNSNYAGINNSFFSTYGPNLNSFTESYDYSKKEDGELETNHSLNFSFLVGGYSLATTIANYVYNGDTAGDAFYTTLSSGLINPTTLIDPTYTRQYYSESYDLLKNTYGFNKKTNYPPILSENSLNVNKDIRNSIILGEDGIINVTEEGKIKAYLDFNQAVNEFNNTLQNNTIFNRCNSFYNSFTTLANVTNGTLNNYPIKNDLVYNKPGLMVSYNISYTDNPNFSTVNDILTYKTIKIDLIEDKYINVIHSYDFNRIAHVSASQTGVMMTMIENADTESSSIITGIYQSNELYNQFLPNIPRIKEVFSLPTRKRNFYANFYYSNEPIYFITIGGITYPKLEYKINDNIPDNIVNEIKIINRPSQTSVLNYAYQDTVGEKTININGYLPRQYGLTFTTPQNINTMFIPLFSWGISTLLNSFNTKNVLAFNYVLTDYKLNFNSDNEFNFSITIQYTNKLYSK